MRGTQVQPKKSSSGSSDDLAGQALVEALQYLKNQWKWSGAHLSHVLHIPASTINTWFGKKTIPISKPLSPDVQAILALIAIHKDLQSMFEKTEHQIKWLNTEHPDMNVKPVKKMEESVEGLIGVRQYLDYVRGRGA